MIKGGPEDDAVRLGQDIQHLLGVALKHRPLGVS